MSGDFPYQLTDQELSAQLERARLKTQREIDRQHAVLAVLAKRRMQAYFLSAIAGGLFGITGNTVQEKIVISSLSGAFGIVMMTIGERIGAREADADWTIGLLKGEVRSNE